MARSPIFLERRSYRLRRMMDAVRLLPLLGLGLWMVPLLWPVPGGAGTAEMPMSTALRYLFVVWALLTLASWALWRRIGGADPEAPGGDGDGGDR